MPAPQPPHHRPHEPGASAASASWHSGMQLAVLMDAALTAGHFALCEFLAPPGAGTPVHRHEHEDEVVFVRRGALEVWEQGRTRSLTAGESMVLPRGRPHRLTAARDAEATEFLLAIVPGGFEATLHATSTRVDAPAFDPDDLAAHFAGAGVTVFGWAAGSA